MRFAAVLLAALGLVALAVASAGAQGTAFNVEIKDRRGDTRSRLDLVRVSLGPSRDGELVGQVTMGRGFNADDLRTATGPQGSLCFKLYVKRVAGEDPPDYLACATPPAQGEELTGRVLRNRNNGLPRTVGVAVTRRLSPRTIELRFPQAAVRSPKRVSFVVEAVSFAEDCARPQGCVDLSPEIRPARLRLG